MPSSPADRLPGLAGRSELRFLTCGSVDDGKSTLIGRLIADSAGLLEDQLLALKDESRRFGTTGDGDVDFALLLDGLEAEREQGITIDVAYRFFTTARRAFVVADTPGHEQYTRNMATGASNAELAVLLVDARKGLLEQTRRHAAIVSLLGIRHVVLAVNKIDLVGYDEAKFREIESAFSAFARPLGFRSVMAIPISARFGDNVARAGTRTPWYLGSTLLAYLETVETDGNPSKAPLRFPVQWVNRPNGDFRGLAGTIASGRVAVGDHIVIAGSGRTTRVARIVTFAGDLPAAEAGRAVTITLADDIDVVRGDMLSSLTDRPTVTRRFAGDVVWMEEEPATVGRAVLLKLGTATVPAVIGRIVDSLDVDSLRRNPAERLSLNSIGRVWLELSQQISLDPYRDVPDTGAFILIDRPSGRTSGAGMVVDTLNRATNVHHQAEDITPAARAAQKGQQAMVVWLTGLPGSGKSTVANLVDRKLVALGHHTMLLDGDNLRQGLNADLGFDIAARSENVRRVGEVAKLMADAGLIVIVALVSPFREDRRRAASLMPDGRFLEVYLDTPVEVCRQRDVKGLYRKASQGKIGNFTGRDQAYEPPDAPSVVLHAADLDAKTLADQLVGRILSRM